MLLLTACPIVIRGAPRLVVGALSIVAGTPRSSQVQLKANASIQSALGFDQLGILVRHSTDTPKYSQ